MTAVSKCDLFCEKCGMRLEHAGNMLIRHPDKQYIGENYDMELVSTCRFAGKTFNRVVITLEETK